jgi:hypothetical protein
MQGEWASSPRSSPIVSRAAVPGLLRPPPSQVRGDVAVGGDATGRNLRDDGPDALEKRPARAGTSIHFMYSRSLYASTMSVHGDLRKGSLPVLCCPLDAVIRVHERNRDDVLVPSVVPEVGIVAFET